MKRFFVLGVAAAIAVVLLSGCTPTGSPGDGVLIPTTKGDNVKIVELSGDATNKLVEGAGASFSEFTPTFNGNVMTFFTSGSSGCKNQPIAAKVGNDATRVAFKIYPKDVVCTADFGIYGWTIEFIDNPPFDGVPFLRCEGDVCYNDTDGTTQVW